MKHWQKYIQKHKAYDKYAVPCHFNYGMVVVIPCYDEPDVLTTLKSLQLCTPAENPVCVLVIVNSGENTDESLVLRNRKTYDDLIEFAKTENQPQLSFHALLCEDLPRKHAGVGLARKIGMEWALRGFMQSKKSDGVIVSLDADCTVSSNYLSSIENQFSTYSPNCCVLNFHHRVLVNSISMEEAIRQYEDYIWYYRDGLKTIGFPYYYHTIGSAFAVSADAYVRVGGIGRQQGGEDFYFLQKIFQLEKTIDLIDSFVFPEARFSERIPFGTGPALEKIITSQDGVLRVYSPESFRNLKEFFDLRTNFFKQPEDKIASLIGSLDFSIQHFLKEYNLYSAITDCNQNASTLATFQKRFFHHFNAFVIIKYMNFVHEAYFSLTSIEVAKNKLDKTL